MLLYRVIMGTQDKDTRARFSPDDIVNDTVPRNQFVQRKMLGYFPNRRSGRDAWTEHATFGDMHTGGIGDDSLFKWYFTAIGKGGDHRRPLAPFAGKTFLSCRIAIGIMQSFDVAAENRLYTQTLHKAIEIHDYTGLITVRIG